MKHFLQRDERGGIQVNESDTIALETKNMYGCLMKTKKLQSTMAGSRSQ